MEPQVDQNTVTLLEAVAEVVKAIVPTAEKLTPSIVPIIEQKISAAVAAAEARIAALAPRVVEFHSSGHKIGEVKGHTRPEFEKIVRRLAAGVPIFLVGPAGCGKTHLAMQLAEALGRPFAAQSCFEGMPPSALFGRINPHTGQYDESDLVRMVRLGGVFLLDEIDGGDANTTLALNMLIANRRISTPAGMVEAHPDFRIIAAANTWGTGADRQYVGRNQLDASTLDRFAAGRFMVGYDEQFEARAGREVPSGSQFVTMCQTIRQQIVASKLRRVMSTRFILDGLKCLAAGDTLSDLLATYMLDWTDDEKRKLAA